jgi:hypothetical protein
MLPLCFTGVRYETARRAMVEQDDFCAKLESEQVENGDTFPENLQWEALIDVLRGRVKVHIHCYEVSPSLPVRFED